MKRANSLTIVLAVLLCSVLVFSLGCGGHQEVAEDQEEEPLEQEQEEEQDAEEENDTEDALVFDDWVEVHTLQDFTDTFERLKWAAHGDVMEFILEGTEEINDTETTKVTIVGNQKPITVWMNDEGDVIRAEVQDMVMEG